MKNTTFKTTMLAALALSISACSSNSTPSAPTQHSYTQFERLARPAVKELFETFVNHQTSNGAEPYNDATLQGSIIAFTDAFRASRYGTALGGASGGTAGILYPDELAFDVSKTTPASYLGIETGGATSKTGSLFGGRDPADDVVAISLGAVFGSTLSALGVVTDDGQENNCLSADNVTQATSQAATSTFPYLAAPH
jgi:hypothetical protein